jgi:hypothetical protein
MSSYDRFINSKGKGYTLLAIKRDEARDRDVKIFYLGEDDHIGINDGVDVWIGSVVYSFPTRFEKGELVALVAKAKAGEAIEVSQPMLQRKKLIQRQVEEVPMERKKLACRSVSHA